MAEAVRTDRTRWAAGAVLDLLCRLPDASAATGAGALPGIHYSRPRSVVYAATEDSWERTIAGHLIAAEADMHRVYRVEVDHPGGHPMPLCRCRCLATATPWLSRSPPTKSRCSSWTR